MAPVALARRLRRSRCARGPLRHWAGAYTFEQSEVADALRRSGAPRAIEALVRKLSNPDSRWRRDAMDALRETDWTPPPELVAELLGCIGLDSASAGKTVAAVRRVGAAATEQLLTVVERHLDARTRELAVGLLAEVGDARAIPLFLGRCATPGSGEMSVAVRALEQILRRDAGPASPENLRRILALQDSYSGVAVGHEADRYDTPVYYPWEQSCADLRVLAAEELRRRGDPL